MNHTLARLLEEGHQLLNAQQLDAAESKYKQAYLLHPCNVDAMYGLGCIYAHQHKFEEALKWTDKILQDKDHPSALELQASCLVEMQLYSAALDIFETIEETNDSAMILAHMGICYFHLEDWELAEEYLREALEGDLLYQSRYELVENSLYHPFYAELHHYLAQSLQHQRQKKEARLHYYLAKCLNPETVLDPIHVQVVSKHSLDIHPYFDFPEFNRPPEANDDPQVIFSYLLQASIEEILELRTIFQTNSHQKFIDEAMATSQHQGELGFTARLHGLSDIVFGRDNGELLEKICSESWQQWFSLADQFHQGTITLDEAVSRHPPFDRESAIVLLKLARRFLNQDPESAQMLITFIERSLSLHEDSEPVTYALSIALAAELEQRLGQAKRSLIRYEKALELISDTDKPEEEVTILFAMGGALYRLQRFGDLLRTLDQIMTTSASYQLYSAHIQACYHRAAIHYEMSAFKACQRDCETALHLIASSQEANDMQQQLAPLYQEACRELHELPSSIIMSLIDEELHFPPEPEELSTNKSTLHSSPDREHPQDIRFDHSHTEVIPSNEHQTHTSSIRPVSRLVSSHASNDSSSSTAIDERTGQPQPSPKTSDEQHTKTIFQNLWQKGIDLLSSEHYEDGLYHLLRAQAQLEASPYRQDDIRRAKQVLLMNDVANALYHLERYDEALQRVERGLFLADQYSLSIDFWPIFCNASLIAIHLKQTEKAILHMESALELARKQDEPKRATTSLKLLTELLIDFKPEPIPELREYQKQVAHMNIPFHTLDDQEAIIDWSDAIEYEYPLFPSTNSVLSSLPHHNDGFANWQAGIDALIHGEYLNAIHAFRQVSLDDGYSNQQIALAQINIGVSYCELGLYPETLSHWKHALNILHTLGDRHRCFSLLCRVLQVSHQIQEHPDLTLRPTQYLDIETQIQKLYTLWSELEPLNLRRNIGLQFADTLLSVLQFDLAEDVLLKTIQEIGGDNDLSHPQQNLKNATKDRSPAHLGPDYQSCDDAMMAYGMLGKIMSHHRRYSEAIECYLCALDGADQLGNLTMMQTINAWLANTLHQANQLNEAAYYYLQAIEGAELSQDKAQLSSLHQQYSSLLFQQNLQDQAISHAKLAIELADKANVTLVAQRSLVNLITFLPGDALPDTLLDRAIQVLDSGLHSKDLMIQSVARAHHASHFLAKGDIEAAIKLFDDVAKTDSTCHRDRYNYCTILLTNARMVQDIAIDRAIAYAYIARDIAMDTDHKEQQINCDELLLNLALNLKSASLIEEHIEYLLPELEKHHQNIRSNQQHQAFAKRFYPLIERCICHYATFSYTQRVIELNNWKSYLARLRPSFS